MSLSPSESQLLLSILNLLLGPGGVGEVLLLLQLGGGVHGEAGGVQGSSVTIRASVTRALVTPGQHPGLAIRSECSQRTDSLTRGSDQAAVDVKVLGINVDHLPGPDVGDLGHGQELGGAGSQGDKNTSNLRVQ